MRENILKQVNEVYKKKNPSFFIKNISKKIEIQKIIKSRKKLLMNLKLPEKVFDKADLLDLGCGSGQNSLAYDTMNANCYLVEYDKKSLENTKNLFEKYGKNKYKFFNKDIFKFKIKKKFDFVISNGVAHHTHNPIKNIDIACKFLKPKGFLILGVCTREGWFQRNLQRAILFSISKNTDEIVINAKRLFKSHLKRSKFFGLRTDDETIYDTYVNPKVNCITIEDINKIFFKNKMSLYSTLNYNKKIEDFLLPYFTQANFSNSKDLSRDSFNIAKLHEFSLTHDDIAESEITNISHYFLGGREKKRGGGGEVNNKLNKLTIQFNDISFGKKINLLSNNLNNLKKTLNNSPKTLLFDKRYNQGFLKDISVVLKILRLKTFQNKKLKYLETYLKKNKYLFKGTCGVGMNYFVGFKN
jgi:SAM-dependent methyltransferase